MPVKFKTTKIAGRAQSDPALYEILRDLGLSSDNLSSGLTAIQLFLVPRGGIVMWPAAVAPAGWLLCNGAAISRTNYAALYTVVGTTYGVGDGSSTFNLPDLRQRFPLGLAASGTGNALGATGGAIDHVHTVDPPSTASGAPSFSADLNNGVGAAISLATDTHTHAVDIAVFDSGANNPPFLTLNFVIKT